MTIATFTLLPVGPRSSNLKKQWFAVLRTLAADTARTGIPDDPLCPWKSDNGFDSLAVGWYQILPSGAPSTKYDVITGIGITPVQPGDLRSRYPQTSDNGFSICRDSWLKTNRNLGSTINQVISFNSDEQELDYYEHVLAFLGSFPGDLPQRLGLIAYVQLDLSSSNTAVPQGANIGIVAVGESKSFNADLTNFVAQCAAKSDYWQNNSISYKNRALLTARTKPLLLNNFGTAVSYPQEISSPTLGPNFADGWFRIRQSYPWTDDAQDILPSYCRIEDRLFDCVQQMPLVGNSAELKKQLLYRTLTRFAQWDPTKQNDISLQVLDSLKLQPADRTEALLRFNNLRTQLLNGPVVAASTISGILQFNNLPKVEELVSYSSEERYKWSRVNLPDFLFYQFNYAIKNIKGGTAPDPAKPLETAWVTNADHIRDLCRKQARLCTDSSFTADTLGFGELLLKVQDVKGSSLTAFSNVKKTCCDWLSDLGAKIMSDAASGYIPQTQISAITQDVWSKYLSTLIDKDWESYNPYNSIKPLPLSVQIDRSSIESNLATSAMIDLGIEDNWRRLTGAGLMIKRDDTNAQWRVCTSGQVFTHNNDPNVSLFGSPSALSAVIPSRLTHRNGVNSATLNYNQTSLTGAVCLTEATNVGYDSPPSFSSSANYEYRTGSDTDSLMLTRLKFGSSYWLAAFMVDFAGGFPDDLSTVNHGGFPWQFDPAFNKVANLPFEKDPKQNISIKVDYFRTTQVSEPRVRITSGSDIPTDVFPIAREIEFDATDPSVGSLAQKPIILVWDDGTSKQNGKPVPNRLGQIEIKPPAVDFDVLERWLPAASDDSAKLQEKNLFYDYYNKVSIPDSTDPTKETWHVDDPAVTSLLLMLDVYDWDTASWRSIDGFICSIPISTASGIARHQAVPITMNFQVNGAVLSTDWSQAQTANPNVTCSLPLAQTTVVRLRTFSLVDKLFIRSAAPPAPVAPAVPSSKYPRFHEETPQFKASPQWWYGAKSPLTQKIFDKLNLQLQNYVPVAPTTTIIEAADVSLSGLPDEYEVWNSYALNIGDESVSVSLIPPWNADITTTSTQNRQIWLKNNWKNVKLVSILKQPWRWQGRPVAPPAGLNNGAWWTDSKVMPSTGNDALSLYEWESIAFLELSNEYDVLQIPTHFSASQLVEVGKIPVSASATFQDNFRSDKRSQYVRYAVKIKSRYAPLSARDTTISSQKLIDSDNTEYSFRGVGWRSFFIPYRGATPKKPIVSGIVQMTENQQDPSSKVASLLVLLSETAFDQCGITETISCRVDAHNFENLAEYGRDPILSAEAIHLTSDETLEKRLLGPFGYTYDIGVRQALYSSSSYVMQPFSTVDLAAKPWDLAKVSFRRLCGNPVIDNQSALIHPELLYTPASWVQFLPSNSFPLTLLKTLPSTADTRFLFTLTDSGPEDLFDWWLLVTKEISDYSGHSNHESFVDCAHLVNDVANVQMIATILKPLDRGRYFLRVLERQTSRLPVKKAASTLWQSLFAYQDSDAEARITRISPPIMFDQE